jgi:hypothetical protein
LFKYVQKSYIITKIKPWLAGKSSIAIGDVPSYKPPFSRILFLDNPHLWMIFIDFPDIFPLKHVKTSIFQWGISRSPASCSLSAWMQASTRSWRPDRGFLKWGYSKKII